MKENKRLKIFFFIFSGTLSTYPGDYILSLKVVFPIEPAKNNSFPVAFMKDVPTPELNQNQ
jgi:hypothetical protein